MINNKTVTIDGKEYPFDNLSEKAKNDLASMQLVILQTARNAYAKSLSEQLDDDKTVQ